MASDDIILDTAELLVDAVALSQALLDGDVPEGRFRARLIAAKASAMGFDEVRAAADQVIDLLGLPGDRPRPGHAVAVTALSEKIESAAEFMRNTSP
ncbi:hypothetical protein [Luteibacter sp. CQ10]|uniref:hypothetical protein n=1 Tax=Luteibacter sp. CQ10 TaxID=2805821 RepID=UPI0034A3CC57